MAGFEEFQVSGVRSARVEVILDGTGVTKGAFYHHFPTKRALAHAVIDEVVAPDIDARWLAPVTSASNPVAGLRRAVVDLESTPDQERLVAGCPLANLLQDVATSRAEAALRERLLTLLTAWREHWSRALASGQARGHVRQDLHPGVTAGFLIATYHGLAHTSRAEQSPAAARRLLRTYATLIDTLGAG